MGGLMGCTHPVLGRPVMLGASVTCGAGAGGALTVDAGVAYSAVVKARHAVAVNCADEGVFMDPLASLHEQAEMAAAHDPTIVIAVDWLFWPVHQSMSSTLAPEERSATRLKSVDAALAELDRFECAVVVGDVPHMKGAAGGVLREAHDPGEGVRAEANARLAAWSAARPNRFVLPIAMIVDAVNTGAPLDIAGFHYGAGECARLVQRDGLHVTSEALALIVCASIDLLEHAGVVEPGLRETDLAHIAVLIQREALAAKDRARPGLLEAFSLSSMYDRCRSELEANDEAGAARTLERLLNRLESFDRNPRGDGDHAVGIGLSLLGLATIGDEFPMIREVFTKHWKRLEPGALADHPNPWRFELWLEYSDQAKRGVEEQTVDALAALRADRGAWQDPFGAMIWGAARFLADERSLARCFPDAHEAYGYAHTLATRDAEWAQKDVARGVYAQLVRARAGWEFLRYVQSRTQAGLPDVTCAFLERARADGFGDAIDAAERENENENENENKNKRRLR